MHGDGFSKFRHGVIWDEVPTIPVRRERVLLLGAFMLLGVNFKMTT